jgi:hypothetical protein
MDLHEVGCVLWTGSNWIKISNRWRALVNAVMNIWVPLNEGNFLTKWKPISFIRRALKMCLLSRSFSQRESKQTDNSLYSCCCSLFGIVSVCRQTDARFKHSKSFSRIQNSQYSLYGPKLRFLCFIKEDVQKKFHKMIQDETIVKCVKQFERICSHWKYETTSFK